MILFIPDVLAKQPHDDHAIKELVQISALLPYGVNLYVFPRTHQCLPAGYTS